MPSPILVTKLFIPAARPKLVLRSRLIKKLQDGLHRKMTLISAPAGFGKTTLANELLQGLDAGSTTTAVAWVSLDENDNDPVRFLVYFAEALNRLEGIETNLGESALGMLGMPQPPPSEAVLTSLINEIAGLTSKILLVLDDYHLIEAQPVHEALNFLLENIPPQLHLVITTREDPPLPLARLRARDQLTELRAADLRFTRDEAANFLNQVMGLNLSEDDIAALDARTEGWIAGLQLAAVALQGAIRMGGKDHSTRLIQTFSGSHRLVLDYLIAEVLQQQPAELQDFLLQTSILNRLTGSLCDALRFGVGKTPDNTGSIAKGQQILENLEHTNLFIIPLDEDRCWYRYHHLFADLLRQRLRQTQPEQLPELHRRASIWYDQQGYRVEAIDHTLQSGDYARAIELIDTDIEGNYEDVALLTLQRWLTAIPDKLIKTHPQMLLLKAWHQFNIGQIENADQSLMDVAQLLETADQLANPMRAALSGRALAIQSFIASLRGDFAGSAQFARQALDLLPASEQAWRSGVTITLGEACAAQGQMMAAQQFRAEALKLSQAAGNPNMIMIANLNLAETLWHQGKIIDVIEICENQMQFATGHDLAETPIIGWLLGLWGAALAEVNQLEQALDLTQKGVELAERGQDLFYISYSYLYRVRVLFAVGDYSAVDAILQEMAHTDALAPWITAQISAWQIRIWLAESKLDLAVQWLNENGPSIDGELPFVYEADYVAAARVLLAEGRLEPAADLLTRLQGVAEVGGRYLRVIELLLLLSIAAQAKDDLPQALTRLEQALILGESRGMIRTFVDEGPHVAQLLYAAVKRNIMPEYVQQIIAAFPIETPRSSTAHPPSHGPSSSDDDWVEPLTDRETEILHLISEGLTNKEIGSRLYISGNTTKAHLRNIFGKLGVKNRTQAVAKGRTLGIIIDR